MLSLIVAAAENNAIGKGNQLIWKLPADLKHFKETTQGHAIIMGRKTYESIGRPLPNRRNIVVTRQTDYAPALPAEAPGGAKAGSVEIAHSLEEALVLAVSDPEPFVIGGAELYKLALPLAERIYLTRIHQPFEGDVFFPELGPEWKEVKKEEGVVDDKNTYPYTFYVLEKKT